MIYDFYILILAIYCILDNSYPEYSVKLDNNNFDQFLLKLIQKTNSYLVLVIEFQKNYLKVI